MFSQKLLISSCSRDLTSVVEWKLKILFQFNWASFHFAICAVRIQMVLRMLGVPLKIYSTIWWLIKTLCFLRALYYHSHAYLFQSTLRIVNFYLAMYGEIIHFWLFNSEHISVNWHRVVYQHYSYLFTIFIRARCSSDRSSLYMPQLVRPLHLENYPEYTYLFQERDFAEAELRSRYTFALFRTNSDSRVCIRLVEDHLPRESAQFTLLCLVSG